VKATAKSQRGDKGVRVFSVTSGKGGVGKTNVAVNLGLALIKLGRRVLLIDADLGLANVDILLGLSPKHTLQDVLTGGMGIEDILVTGPDGIKILPAASGIQEITHLSSEQQLLLLAEVDKLEDQIDIVLIDTSAGISHNVMFFNIAAQDIVVVVTPDPTSMTDAYALIKVLYQKYAEKSVYLLINQVVDETEAKEIYKKITAVCERFLHLSVGYLGFVEKDDKLVKSVRMQKPVIDAFPVSPSSRCFKKVASDLLNIELDGRPKGNIQFLWKRLLRESTVKG